MSRTPHRILVVNDNPGNLVSLLAMLREAGYEASGVTSSDSARSALAAGAHDLIVTDVRVGRSNGLHLMKGVRVSSPEARFILVADSWNTLLDMEARRVGAVLQTRPLRRAEFLAVVAEQLATIPRRQRWPRKPVTAPVMLQVAGRPARLVDVSYGGLRFDMLAPHGGLPSPLPVRLPVHGVSVEADLIWSARHENDTLWRCGAAILTADAHATRGWRAMVDRMPG